jgi:hypothetical protein
MFGLASHEAKPGLCLVGEVGHGVVKGLKYVRMVADYMGMLLLRARQKSLQGVVDGDSVAQVTIIWRSHRTRLIC